MSLSDAAESDLLKLLFTNTTWANFGDVTGIVGSGSAGNLYLSMHTADPGEGGTQSTNEATYTSYARVAVARTGGNWTISGTSPTQVSNANTVSFPACTGGTNTITHIGIGLASSGANELLVIIPLTVSLTVTSGVTPQYAAGALVTTAD